MGGPLTRRCGAISAWIWEVHIVANAGQSQECILVQAAMIRKSVYFHIQVRIYNLRLHTPVSGKPSSSAPRISLSCRQAGLLIGLGGVRAVVEEAAESVILGFLQGSDNVRLSDCWSDRSKEERFLAEGVGHPYKHSGPQALGFVLP